MSAPELRWCEHTGMVLRRGGGDAWMVLDAIGEADPAAVAEAESLILASGPDPAFIRLMWRTAGPVAGLVALAVLAGAIVLGPHWALPLAVQGIVFGFIGWLGWVVWLAGQSDHFHDRWLA